MPSLVGSEMCIRDSNRPCRGRVVDSSGLVVLSWCRECDFPGVPFLAGILVILRAPGIVLVSLLSVWCWAGFSYSSYSFLLLAVAIALGLSLSWMRRNALRCLILNCWVGTSSDRSLGLGLRRCWTSADDYRRCRQYNNGIRPLSLGPMIRNTREILRWCLY